MPAPVQSFERSFGVLEHALQVSLLRHRTIESNLAHADTPGYKRLEVNFESLLEDRLAGGAVDPRVFRSVQPAVVADTSPGKADGNNVELDRESSELEKNRLQYEVLSEIASQRFSGLKQVIQSK